jgi:hypothetical protein
MKSFKLGANAERHMKKYAGTSNEDYIEFAAQTARKVTTSRFDTEICERLDIYNIAHLPFKATQLPFGIEEYEADDYLLEHSNNPLELAELWQKAKANESSDSSKNFIISEFLKPFPKESFERFADKNWLSDVSKAWFNKDGLALDVQAQEMNSLFFVEDKITIDDLIEFVRTYKRYSYKSPATILVERIEQRFKDSAGFQIKDYYVEHLLKSCYPKYEIETFEDVPF